MTGLTASLIFFAGLYIALAVPVSALVRAGLLSLAPAPCAAVGAMSAVLVWQSLAAFDVALLMAGGATAMVAGALSAVILSFCVWRLEGDAILVVTLLTVVPVRQAIDLSGGLGGAGGVAVKVLSGWQPHTRYWVLCTAAWLLALFTLAVARRASMLGLGSVLDTIRHDSQVAGLSGIAVRRVRAALLVWSGAVAGAAGALYAAFQGHVAASAFDVWFAILVLAMAIAGWMRGFAGLVTAVIVLHVVPEMLRLFAGRVPVSLGRLETLSTTDLWPLVVAAILLALARLTPRAIA